MKYVTGTKIKKGDHPQFPWEVHVAKRLFGKRSRKKFETEVEAKAHATKMSRRIVSKERVPLNPEVHKIVALFAEKLTPFQIQTILEEGVRRYSVESKGSN